MQAKRAHNERLIGYIFSVFTLRAEVWGVYYKLTTGETSDANDAQSHAREKHLLAGYSVFSQVGSFRKSLNG